MSVGKPFSEPYGALAARRQLAAVWTAHEALRGAQLDWGGAGEAHSLNVTPNV